MSTALALAQKVAEGDLLFVLNTNIDHGRVQADRRPPHSTLRNGGRDVETRCRTFLE